jgi:hypothetical protein
VTEPLHEDDLERDALAAADRADSGSPPGTPRWVLVMVLIAVLFVIGAVIFLVVSGHAPRLLH